jgi:hypothetical protein
MLDLPGVSSRSNLPLLPLEKKEFHDFSEKMR